MKNQLLSLFSICLFSFAAFTQNVNIPDANFKAYLLSNTFINTTNDGNITLSEAAAFNGVMNCSSLSISNLTGIEAFTGYLYLNCSSNAITTLDFSANIHMQGTLEVGGNPLTSLILPPSITSLKCQNTSLTSLDLSNTPTLTHMWSNMTPFTSIDFSNSSGLIGMNLDGNHMTSIDLSSLTSLEWIYVTQSTLETLDVSVCPSLISLTCMMNDNLTALNVKNGNNMNFAPGSFDATNCPLLGCVTVDNVAFANQVWSSDVDAGVVFSSDCSQVTTLATSITIEGQSETFSISTPGGSLQIVPTILPTAASTQSVLWGIVSGSNYATISQSGVLTATGNGVVTVGAMTTDGSGLSATTNITISNQVAGMNSLEIENFKISPNPASTNISITSNSEVESVSIYNLLGSLVQVENTTSFSIESLPKGIYQVVVTTSNGISQSRFMKQ